MSSLERFLTALRGQLGGWLGSADWLRCRAGEAAEADGKHKAAGDDPDRSDHVILPILRT
ncbi:hypothetical protein MACH15_19810 [Maricaulis maris]|nr:hypothetical protein MACH15_19810 [Maricaulis maris]